MPWQPECQAVCLSVCLSVECQTFKLSLCVTVKLSHFKNIRHLDCMTARFLRFGLLQYQTVGLKVCNTFRLSDCHASVRSECQYVRLYFCHTVRRKDLQPDSLTVRLSGHQNPISGSTVTAILLKGWILSIGGFSSGRVCACSLRTRLVLVLLPKSFPLLVSRSWNYCF